MSEAERVAHCLNAEADRHKQLALDRSQAMADSSSDSNTRGSRRSTASCYADGAQVADAYEPR